MSVDHVEFIVEEPWMEAFLRLLVPRIAGGVSFEVYPFQCKDELQDKLADRLRGYASWLPDTWRIVVVVDRADDDCHELKEWLEDTVTGVRLVTRSRAEGSAYAVANRLAIEELEAWYFGDVAGLRRAYPRVPESLAKKVPYRDPDAIVGGTWEALERVLQRAGYFQGGLRKIEAAREIAQHMDPAVNQSRSFQVFRDTLVEMSSG